MHDYGPALVIPGVPAPDDGHRPVDVRRVRHLCGRALSRHTGGGCRPGPGGVDPGRRILSPSFAIAEPTNPVPSMTTN